MSRYTAIIRIASLKMPYRAAFAVLLALAAVLSRVQAAPPGLTLETAIPLPGVEGRFDHFAVDVKGQRLFVSALGNDTLEVLDLHGNKHLRSVRGMHEPQGVAFASAENRIYVGNGGSGTCEGLDAATFAPLSKVTGLEDADNVRYDAAPHEVWVGYGRGGLAVLDARTGKRLGSVGLSAHPESFQLERAGPRIWVNLPGSGQIAVVDRVKRKLLSTWPVKEASSNFPMALDEAHHRLLVGCRKPARLLVLDTETGHVVTSAEIAGDTDDLFYDAATKSVYVICGEGFVTVLQQKDPDHYSQVHRLATAPGARTGFFLPEASASYLDRSRLYVAVPHRGPQRAEVRVYAAAK